MLILAAVLICKEKHSSKKHTFIQKPHTSSSTNKQDLVKRARTKKNVHKIDDIGWQKCGAGIIIDLACKKNRPVIMPTLRSLRALVVVKLSVVGQRRSVCTG